MFRYYKNMHFDSSKITGQHNYSSAMGANASFNAPVESLNFQMRPGFGSQDRSTLPQRQHQFQSPQDSRAPPSHFQH